MHILAIIINYGIIIHDLAIIYSGTSDYKREDTIKITSLQRTHFKFPNIHFLDHIAIHFEPLKSRQPLYKGQNEWTQCVLCSEVPPL